MSWLRVEDYLRENKRLGRNNSGIRKTALPTKFRTRKRKCSHCTRTDGDNYKISEKETRWLCPQCKEKFLRKDIKEKPNFIKASRLKHDT